jgi:hypothetical protein
LKISMIILTLIGVLVLCIGCAPAKFTTNLGGNKHQIETRTGVGDIFKDPGDLSKAWHEQARATCRGEYNVINNQIIQGTAGEAAHMVGTIECK